MEFKDVVQFTSSTLKVSLIGVSSNTSGPDGFSGVP